MKLEKERLPDPIAVLAGEFDLLAARYEDILKSAEPLEALRRDAGTILPILAGTFLLAALDRGLFAKTVRPVWDLRDYWSEQLDESGKQVLRFVEEARDKLADSAKSDYGYLAPPLLKPRDKQSSIARRLESLRENAMKLLERRDSQSEVEIKGRQLLSMLSWFVYLRLELIPENSAEFRADWPDVIPVVLVPPSRGAKIIGTAPSEQFSLGLPGQTKRDKRQFQVRASADIQAMACRHVAAWLRELSKSANPSLRVATKTTDVGRQSKPRGARRPGINAQMLEAMQANLEEVTGWTSTRWAKHLKCAKSSIVATATWKDLTMARERVKAERAVARRRKPKASDRNRTK